MENDIYKRAIMQGVTFDTSKGTLDLYGLFDLIKSRKETTLKAGKAVLNALFADLRKEQRETSGDVLFGNANSATGLLNLKLAIVEDVAATLKNREEGAALKAELDAQEEFLITALKAQEEKQVMNADPEELRKRIAEIKAKKAAL